ncbi:MAG: S1C family serine protease [Caulobacterales bacterium]|jgi:2-alkenal reductase
MTDTTRRAALLGAVALSAFGLAQCGRSAESQSRGATARAVAARTPLTGSERDIVALFERTAPSVVQVVVVARSLGQMGVREVGGGSGFVWDTNGHIVTNFHVVEGAPGIIVRLATGESLPAEIVGAAPNHDLAVLRVQSRESLPAPVPVGSSADLRVGQTAFAIGNPFGLDQTLTQGIVSALGRRIPTQTGREIADVIQTDAPINPGNSGGPLLDSAGRLIGVNTAIFSPSGASAGIGFAIPVDTVNRVVPQIIATGRAPIPGIGVAGLDEARSARLGVNGVVVMQVNPGSPAARSGLRPATRNGAIQDVIVAANGQPTRRLMDLIRIVDSAGIGATVMLQVENNGTVRETRVQVVDIGG